jgi:hypothetical protein
MRDNGGSRGRLDGRVGAVLGALLVVALAIFVFMGASVSAKRRSTATPIYPSSHGPKYHPLMPKAAQCEPNRTVALI